MENFKEITVEGNFYKEKLAKNLMLLASDKLNMVSNN
jgi:hypothetical protein